MEVDRGQLEEHCTAQRQQAESRQRLERGEVRCVELAWYETLPVLVRDCRARIRLSLMSGTQTIGAWEVAPE